MLSRLRDTVELQTSNSDMKELPQEDVLEDEDIENLLEVSRTPDSRSVCLVIVTIVGVTVQTAL